jgi:hypothetical protein
MENQPSSPIEEVRYAGRLSNYYNQWSCITNDKTILSWIRGYKLNFSAPVQQNPTPVVPNYSLNESAQYEAAISDLLRIGTVSTCQPCQGQFISGIFLRPKPNGKKRFIINLKKKKKNM